MTLSRTSRGLVPVFRKKTQGLGSWTAKTIGKPARDAFHDQRVVLGQARIQQATRS